MGTMATMGHSGDTKIIWDADNEAEVENAREVFERLTGKSRYLAFKATGKDGAKGAQIRAFDPAAERIILVPPMAGG